MPTMYKNCLARYVARFGGAICHGIVWVSQKRLMLRWTVFVFKGFSRNIHRANFRRTTQRVRTCGREEASQRVIWGRQKIGLKLKHADPTVGRKSNAEGSSRAPIYSMDRHRGREIISIKTKTKRFPFKRASKPFLGRCAIFFFVGGSPRT